MKHKKDVQKGAGKKNSSVGLRNINIFRLGDTYGKPKNEETKSKKIWIVCRGGKCDVYFN